MSKETMLVLTSIVIWLFKLCKEVAKTKRAKDHSCHAFHQYRAEPMLTFFSLSDTSHAAILQIFCDALSTVSGPVYTALMLIGSGRLLNLAVYACTGLGFTMDTLDIGGGFCDDRMLGDVAAAVNAALALHFPVSDSVRVIAEPGRCASEACSLFKKTHVLMH